MRDNTGASVFMLGIPVLLSWFVYYNKGADDHTARFFHIQETPHTFSDSAVRGIEACYT